MDITKSTFWSKEGHKGFLFQAQGKAIDINPDYKISWTIDHSTFYQIGVGKKINNTNTFKGKNYLSMTLTNSILCDFASNTGSEVNGWLFGQNSTNPTVTYEKNTYWKDGAVVAGWTDSSKAGYDASETSLTTDPGFKDAANGDFTLSMASIQSADRIGDPRWFNAVGTVLHPADGTVLNEAVDAVYAAGKPNMIIMRLADKGKYTVTGSLFIDCPLIIVGADSTEIDAADSNSPFILMRPVADDATLNAYGAREIDQVYIKDVKIKNLKNRLFYADRKDYLFGLVGIENCDINIDGTIARTLIDFYCGGNTKELSIKNSTIWAEPSNVQRGGLFNTQGSKGVVEMCGEYGQLISITNSTLYNLAYGMTPVLLDRHSQYGLSFELRNNIIVNCGQSGMFVVGLNEGVASDTPEWSVSDNMINFDGEDMSENEKANVSVGDIEIIPAAAGTVTFADAAAGDFNGTGRTSVKNQGDPRWTNDFILDVDMKVVSGDIAEALEKYLDGQKYGNVVINLEKDGQYTINKSIVANESFELVGNGATIDASALTGAMVTQPTPVAASTARADEATPEWTKAEKIRFGFVKITGLKKALFAATTKNYLYNNFEIQGVVAELAGDATTIDFTNGSVAKTLSVDISTFYAPTATTKAFYSSQNGQKATDAGDDVVQEFEFYSNTMYNLAKGKNFFSHRQSNQKWLSYDVMRNLFVNCGKSGQVIKGMNGGQGGKNPTWNISDNAFNFDGADTSAAESTGDDAEAVENSVAGVMAFKDADNGDFNGTFTLGEGATAPAQLGDHIHWTIEFVTPTGINAVKSDDASNLENATIYNLNGQRVEKAGKGLYIINGKKVVIK